MIGQMQYFLLGYEILVFQVNLMVPNHSMFVCIGSTLTKVNSS